MTATESRDCLLYLTSPLRLEVKIFVPELEAALAAAPGRVGAFLLRLEDKRSYIAAAAVLQPICAVANVAFFLFDDAELVTRLDCDGVHLAEGADIASARKIIGNDKVIGVDCADRDAAMEAGNAGADYVAFTKNPELLLWWQDYFVLPCLAAANDTPAECGNAMRAGADFAGLPEMIWQNPGKAAEAVKAFDDAVREALQRL